MTVPAYAAHLSQDDYREWSLTWPRWHYTLEPVQTPEDAAVLLMIAAVEATDEQAEHLTYNDGRFIESIAALVQYKTDLAIQGMDIALQNYDLETYGVKPLRNLTSAIQYDSYQTSWTVETVQRLTHFVQALPFDSMVIESRNDETPERDILERTLTACIFALRRHPDMDESLKARILDISKGWIERYDMSQKSSLNPPVLGCMERLASDDDLQTLAPGIKGMFGHFMDESFVHDTLWRNYPRLSALVGVPKVAPGWKPDFQP